VQENVAFPSPQTSSPDAVAPTAKPAAKRWPLYLLGGVTVALVIAVGVAGGAYSNWASGQLIAPGVAIAGVPVGGLTKENAQQELENRFGRAFVALQTDARPFQVSLRELGGAPSIAPVVQKAYAIGRSGNPVTNFLRVYTSKSVGERFMLPMQWNKGALVAKLYTINHIYKQPAKDARLHVGENGVEIVREQVGKELNIGETALQLQKKYYIGLPQIEAVTRDVMPKIASADLAGQDVQLAHYTTRFNAGLAGRTTNIRVACEAIEGLVLMPGESFSFNQMTGERTWEKGYRMAHIFERKPGQTESEVVDGLAGGVCQVSSTLFNAVLNTNEKVGSRRLRILERSTHSLPVTYVPRGMDATVAWPSKDFRFRNNFDHPVYLKTSISRSHLTIGIWGRVKDEQALQMASLPDEDTETNN
jgi:vancomycin resistance protein YoaR